MSSMWMPQNEPEEDVWEMLHQMMDDPAPASSLLLAAQVITSVYKSVGMYVSMYACMHVYSILPMYVCLYVCMHVYSIFSPDAWACI